MCTDKYKNGTVVLGESETGRYAYFKHKNGQAKWLVRNGERVNDFSGIPFESVIQNGLENSQDLFFCFEKQG